MKRCLLIILASLFTFTASLAQDFIFSGKKKRESIPFKTIKNMIIIPVEINGKGPFNFILDTGIGLLLITDPKLTDSLKLKSLTEIQINGLGEGNALRAYYTRDLSLKIGSATASHCGAGILMSDMFDLSGYVGMPIHGLIGFQFFDSFTVKINYSTNQLTYYLPEVGYSLRKGYSVPITLEDRKPYVVTETVLSNGDTLKTKLIIDTGAGHPLSLESYDGKPFVLPTQVIKANLGVGLGGSINGYLGRVKSLKIGKFELKNVTASFPNYAELAAKLGNTSRNGNLGSSIMKKFNVVFDYSRQVMYLKPNIYYKEPFEHDMTGLELYASGDNLDRVFISRVEEHSSAEECGLQPQDEIISVNFKPATELKMDGIEQLFKSKDDRSFLLEISRKGVLGKYILTLKRRI